MDNQKLLRIGPNSADEAHVAWYWASNNYRCDLTNSRIDRKGGTYYLCVAVLALAWSVDGVEGQKLL
jgi:hypothetical protein